MIRGGAGSFHGSGLGHRGGGLSMDGGVGEGMSEIKPGHASGRLNFRQRQDFTKVMLDSISASTSGVSRRHRIFGMPGAGSSEGLNPIVPQGYSYLRPDEDDGLAAKCTRTAWRNRNGPEGICAKAATGLWCWEYSCRSGIG